MKESELRAIIREHIKRTLKEAGPSLGAGQSELERGLGKVSKTASKMSKRQRVQAVIPVLQKFGIEPNDLSLVKAVLTKMSAPEPKPEPEPEPKPEPKPESKPSDSEESDVEENYTAGVDDGDAGKSIAENVLDSRSEKLDKTQAFKLLQRAVETKPATMQADFIIDLINKFNLDDSAKRRLKQNIRNLA